MTIALSFREAMQSPCLSCQTSPCCTHVLLRKFELEDLGDVDYLVYLANFEGILLGVDEEGVARVYLYQPCSHLDVPTGLCQVHGTPEQPSICVHYNAHACQYRHGMTADLNPHQPLMDASRTRWYAEHVRFDDERKIVERPVWGELLEAFATMPLERRAAPPPGPDRVLEEWRQVSLTAKDSNGAYRDRSWGDTDVSDPCTGCEAWCCKTLVFGRDIPENANQFDFFRYLVGFPGVEIGVSEQSWAIVVKTTCRHLVANRCSIYGHEDRPLRCGYYDELKCVYREQFGAPRPADLVRVNRQTFAILAESVVFDEKGRVRRLPATDKLRFHMEEAMRAGRV